MRQLGELVLPDSIQWVNRHKWSPVAQNTMRTLGGQLLVFSQELNNGRPITLFAEEDVTWFDQTAVDAIQEMAAQPGLLFNLIWDEENWQVMFRHNEPPATSFEPLWPHHDQFTGNYQTHPGRVSLSGKIYIIRSLYCK